MTKQKQNFSPMEDRIEKGDAANKQHVGHLPERKNREKGESNLSSSRVD